MILHEKIEEALCIIACYGGISGADHKQWVLDQVARILAGVEDGWYNEWVREYQEGEDGPETYLWDEGIAP